MLTASTYALEDLGLLLDDAAVGALGRAALAGDGELARAEDLLEVAAGLVLGRGHTGFASSRTILRGPPELLLLQFFGGRSLEHELFAALRLEAVVDERPGALDLFFLGRGDLAEAVVRAAAGAVQRLLQQRTMGQTPPVSPMPQSPQAPQRSSHTACSCGMPSMLVLTAGKTSLGENFSAMLWMPMPQAMLSTTSASLDLVGDHVEVLPLALADGRGVLDLDLAAVLLRLDAQLAGEDLGLLLAAGQADGDAGVAAGDEDLLLALDEREDLVEGLAFSSDHAACPSSAVAAAGGGLVVGHGDAAERLAGGVVRAHAGALHGAGAELLDALGELGGDLGEPGAHGRRHVVHLDALGLDAHLGEQVLDVVDPLARPEVALEVVALALQAAGGVDAVGAGLDGAQQVDDLELAGAGQLDHADVGRVLQAHAAGQVGGRVGAVVAGEDDDLRLEAGVDGLLRRLGLAASGASPSAAVFTSASAISAHLHEERLFLGEDLRVGVVVQDDRLDRALADADAAALAGGRLDLGLLGLGSMTGTS